jgi:hypothetical protein
LTIERLRKNYSLRLEKISNDLIQLITKLVLRKSLIVETVAGSIAMHVTLESS